MTDPVEIISRDFWVKVVEMLQQNWALVDAGDDASARIYFVSDTGGVFDEMLLPSREEAESALRRNGFRRFSASPDLQAFLSPPREPFQRARHPNGPIYSSGRFWRS
jgi:hypothetical protein